MNYLKKKPVPALILACESFRPYEKQIQNLRPDAGLMFLPMDIHAHPEKLRQEAEEILGEVGPCEVYFLYGACAFALGGMNCGDATVHLLAKTDCAAILSETGEGENRKGAYFVTPGLARSKGRPAEEYEKLREQYGEERARSAFGRIYQDVDRVVTIGEDEKTREEGERLAKLLGVSHKQTKADLKTLEAFLTDEPIPEARCYLPGETIPAGWYQMDQSARSTENCC